MSEAIEKLINVEQAAEILALRPSTIRGMVQRKTIPVVRPAGKRVVRFRLGDVLRLAQLVVPEHQAATG